MFYYDDRTRIAPLRGLRRTDLILDVELTSAVDVTAYESFFRGSSDDDAAATWLVAIREGRLRRFSKDVLANRYRRVTVIVFIEKTVDEIAPPENRGFSVLKHHISLIYKKKKYNVYSE